MDRRNRQLMVVVYCTIAMLGGGARPGAQGSAVPSPWASRDIGSPAIGGASSFDQASGTFSIDAAGANIGGTADQFHFVYQPLVGDTVITARVDTLSAVSPGSKAGVMIRSSLAADAAHGYAFVSAGNGAGFRRRRSAGGTTANTSGSTTAVAPLWVRLVRSGSTVTASMSSNGTSWTTIASDTVALGGTAYVGLAVTSRNVAQSTSAAVSSVTATGTGALPSPQQSQDIGSPAITGTAAFSEGRYTVTAAGSGTWDAADQFHYVYQPLTGDMDVSVRVVSLTGSTPQAKAGVMIRADLTPGSAHALAALSVDQGYRFQRRPTAGGTSLQSTPVAAAPPGWVRLKRSGDLITAYHSLDGTAWTAIGSDAIPMADTVYVGIAVTSHDVSAVTTATLTDLIVTQLQPPNQAPTATLSAPADGATYTAPATIALTVSASDPDGTVARVEIYNGTTLLASDTTAPYAFTWSNVAAGTYELKATAVDDAGARGSSSVASVTVNAANQPPGATLTAPANGAAYAAPATITLTASASDPDGTVARVEFYNGTTLLGSDTTAPYAFTWSNVAAGTYALRATAVDNASASGSSATATITVAAPAGGLVSAYGLNEGAGTTVGDSAGNTPGTLTGASWMPGRYGQALSFDGSDHVMLGDTDLPGSFTVMGWLQTRSLHTTGCASFVMKAFDYGLEMCSGQLWGSVGTGTGWTATVKYSWPAGDLNVWKHVALTYDGTTIRLYVEGMLVGSGTGAHASNNNPLLFGRWTPASEYWNGLIDEVRIYNRSLTQAEIQTDRNSPIGGGGNQPPTATLTAPANGASFTAPASITMTATASDADGSVARVDFYNGTTLLGSDTTAPYAFTWSGVAAGTYALRAIVSDNAGASTTSATATITVSAAPTPTAIVFRASVDHAIVTSYFLEIFANGADPNTAPPVASSDLGAPTPDANGDITVNRAALFSALPPGTHVCTVSSIGSGGRSRSQPLTFTR